MASPRNGSSTFTIALTKSEHAIVVRALQELVRSQQSNRRRAGRGAFLAEQLGNAASREAFQVAFEAANREIQRTQALGERLDGRKASSK